MSIHKNLPSSECHEAKQIIDATTADAGKVITPSASTNGVAVLRRLTLDDVDPGTASEDSLLTVEAHTVVPTSTISITKAVTLISPDTGAVVTAQLPVASTMTGKRRVVKRTGNLGTINLTSAGGNIDTIASISLATSYDSVTVISDGADWWII